MGGVLKTQEIASDGEIMPEFRDMPEINTSEQNKINEILDQIFDIERKLESVSEPNSIQRNINRLKDAFRNFYARANEFDVGCYYENPIGEPYDATRTNVEARIAGESSEDLEITEVIKPIIRRQYKSGEDRLPINIVIRPGVVVVESKKKMEEKNNE